MVCKLLRRSLVHVGKIGAGRLGELPTSHFRIFIPCRHPVYLESIGDRYLARAAVTGRLNRV